MGVLAKAETQLAFLPTGFKMRFLGDILTASF